MVPVAPSRPIRPAGALTALAVLLCCACAVPEVEVMAIANEGFLIRSARRAVLVDALFRATAPYPEFYQQAPSEGLLEVMVSGGGAFERVDLVLVTHGDPDHFHAPTAAAFLAQHPESVLVGTGDVAAGLAGQPEFDRIAERVLTPDLGWAECTQLSPNGLEITVCRVRHSGGRDVPNNLYLVDLDGFRFAHEGDAERAAETFSLLAPGDHGLDLAFLHDWFVLSPEGREIMSSTLRPRAIVLMHLRWAVSEPTRQRLADLPDEVAAALPPVTVLGAETARTTFRVNR